MGEVHEVEDCLLDRRVALKTLNASVLDDVNALRRLRSEVKLAHQVTDRNVCRIFDFVIDVRRAEERRGELAFLTMELLDGESLAATLRRRGALSVQEALPLLRQIAAGLAAAHEAGVVHHDLKPENVMLVAGEGAGTRAVITDFGLAVAASARSQSRSRAGFVGTPAYAAPEQLVGRRGTPASDVYAFGLLATEMLTGVPPSAELAGRGREGKDPGTVARGVLGSRGASQAWRAAIVRALDVDPSRRFADGVQLVVELARADAGASTSARRRWPELVAAALGLTLAAGGVAVWAGRVAAPLPAAIISRVRAASSSSGREPAPASPPQTSPPALFVRLAAPPAVAMPSRRAAEPSVARRRAVPVAAMSRRGLVTPAAAVDSVPARSSAEAASDEIVRDLPVAIPARPSIEKEPAPVDPDLFDPFEAGRSRG